MTLTILSAAKEVKALENPDMVAIAKAISSGSLRGARGNSGVILSQLLRGFTKEIREHKEIDTITLAKACERATATAYKAVMKPKEGTILTVAKGASQKAAELAETTEDLDTFISEVINYAQEVLEKTPEMLPVLKRSRRSRFRWTGTSGSDAWCIRCIPGKKRLIILQSRQVPAQRW